MFILSVTAVLESCFHLRNDNVVYIVSRFTGPVTQLQITLTILVQCQQILVQKIAIWSALNSTCNFVKKSQNRVPAEVFLWHPQYRGNCTVILQRNISVSHKM